MSWKSMARCRGVAAMVGLCVGLCATAKGQVHFGADLTGAEEVPPVGTNAGGFASFVLNPDNSVTYRVLNYGLVGTDAHVHDGVFGQNGSVLFALQGGPSLWTGTSAPLSATNVTKLRSQGLYVNVHTAAHPAGEIRGQIRANPTVFGAHLTGDQEVPPVSTNETGDATFVVNPDLTITYSVVTNVTNGTDSHIHLGAFGQNGSVAFALSGGPQVWSGTTAAMNVDQYATLQTQGYYVNVHSTDQPAGKIRGQITATYVPYGPPCPSSVGTALLTVEGAPVSEGSLTLRVNGGLPGGFGFLFTSLSDGASQTKGACNYLLGAPFFFFRLGLDGSGDLALPQTLPILAGDLDFFVQFLGVDPASANGGLYNTNAVKIPLQVF